MRRPPILAILLGLTALAFVVERLIETDMESIERWARDASDALDAGDMDALGELLTEDFTYGRRDRESALRYAGAATRNLGASAIEIALRSVEIEGDTAKARAYVFGTLAGRRYRYETRVTLERGPDGWLLATATEINY